jgi:hypothetical protein
MREPLLALGRLHLNGADTSLRELKDDRAAVPRLDRMDKFEQHGIGQVVLLQHPDQTNHGRCTQAHEVSLSE